MTGAELGDDYERATGDLIVETLGGLGLDASDMPATLVGAHGPFTWGSDAADAVVNAVAVEAVAALAYRTLALDADAATDRRTTARTPLQPQARPAAYYGQRASDRPEAG